MDKNLQQSSQEQTNMQTPGNMQMSGNMQTPENMQMPGNMQMQGNVQQLQAYEEQRRKQQMLVYGQQVRQQQEQEEREKKKGASVFGKLGAASLLYTLFYTICLYKNTMGIVVLLWVAACIGYVYTVQKIFGITGKRDSVFLIAVMGLLGVSTFLTGNRWIVWMNYALIFLLLVALLIHNFAKDDGWDFGRWGKEIFVAVFGAVGAVGKPFSDGSAFYRSRPRQKSKNGYYILIGIGAAVPCLLFLGVMLASADMVFADMVGRFFLQFRVPAKCFGVIFMLCFGFFSSYCGVRYVEGHAASVSAAGETNAEPLIAIAFTAPIALLYVVFSMIQIVYLFVGGMQLPEGVTYAEYARRGFFQLLFVCALNLVLVLIIQKYFGENPALKVLLLVISGCTFVMTASSACRMVLYIKAYQLTFLRVFVLVALAVIALLMAGIAAKILLHGFPLFRYGVAAVCAVYLAFSFSHVDYFIASYNLSHPMTSEENGGETVDYDYLGRLSTDAAPAIERYIREQEADVKWEELPSWYKVYRVGHREETEHITLRNFNLSHYIAGRLLRE